MPLDHLLNTQLYLLPVSIGIVPNDELGKYRIRDHASYMDRNIPRGPTRLLKERLRDHVGTLGQDADGFFGAQHCVNHWHQDQSRGKNRKINRTG